MVSIRCARMRGMGMDWVEGVVRCRASLSVLKRLCFEGLRQSDFKEFVVWLCYIETSSWVRVYSVWTPNVVGCVVRVADWST